MLFRIRNLRLLAVIAATVILLLMLFARRSGDWLLGYGLIDEWHRGTVSHEAFLTYLVKRKLHEPIAPLDSAIKQFVKPEMDETGFVKWMKEVAPKQPLVGAGFDLSSRAQPAGVHDEPAGGHLPDQIARCRAAAEVHNPDRQPAQLHVYGVTVEQHHHDRHQDRDGQGARVAPDVEQLFTGYGKGAEHVGKFVNE